MPASAQRRKFVGVIGLGAMGGSMAARLVSRGFAVIGYDVDRAANERAAQNGVVIAQGAADVARRAAYVVCMVDTSAQTEEAAFGGGGVASAAQRGDIFIATSTIELETTLKCHEALSKAGVEFVDAPVSGGPVAAAAGNLNILVGANAMTVKACRPILEALSQKYFHMGEVGSGFAAKMVNNILFHSISVAIIEAMVLGTRAGLDPRQMYDLISNATGNSAAFQVRVPRFLERNFEGTPMYTAYREMVMETGFARLKGVPVPLAAAAEQIYLAGMNRGLGNKDGAALVQVYEDWAGVRVEDTRRTHN